MKTIIIYQSIHHGNTKKVAEAISKVLKAKLVKLHEVDVKSLKKYALFGFGSGIYAGKHHKFLLDFCWFK